MNNGPPTPPITNGLPPVENEAEVRREIEAQVEQMEFTCRILENLIQRFNEHRDQEALEVIIFVIRQISEVLSELCRIN